MYSTIFPPDVPDMLMGFIIFIVIIILHILKLITLIQFSFAVIYYTLIDKINLIFIYYTTFLFIALENSQNYFPLSSSLL